MIINEIKNLMEISLFRGARLWNYFGHLLLSLLQPCLQWPFPGRLQPISHGIIQHSLQSALPTSCFVGSPGNHWVLTHVQTGSKEHLMPCGATVVDGQWFPFIDEQFWGTFHETPQKPPLILAVVKSVTYLSFQWPSMTSVSIALFLISGA